MRPPILLHLLLMLLDIILMQITHMTGSPFAKFAAVHATNPHGSPADVSDFVLLPSADPKLLVSHKQLTTQVEQLTQHLQIKPALTYRLPKQNTITSPTDEYSVSGSTVTTLLMSP